MALSLKPGSGGSPAASSRNGGRGLLCSCWKDASLDLMAPITKREECSIFLLSVGGGGMRAPASHPMGPIARPALQPPSERTPGWARELPFRAAVPATAPSSALPARLPSLLHASLARPDPAALNSVPEAPLVPPSQLCSSGEAWPGRKAVYSPNLEKLPGFLAILCPVKYFLASVCPQDSPMNSLPPSAEGPTPPPALGVSVAQPHQQQRESGQRLAPRP